MQAVNDYVIVDIIKEGPRKVGGLILTEEADNTNRYRKANVLSTGELVEVVKTGDSVYYDAIAGHDIAYDDSMYRVIRARDIVIVE
jgi:co-chaperonin GroES (HSP10)